MKLIILSLIFLGTLFGQCSYTTTLTTASATTPFNNTILGCDTWQLTYTSSGFNSLIIQAESSPNSATTGYSAVQVNGNPSSALNSTLIFSSSAAALRINLIYVRGNGSVNISLIGTKSALIAPTSNLNQTVPLLIPETAATVSHVWFNQNGIQDTRNLAWQTTLAPPVYKIGPPVLVSTATRTNVGVFSDSNYFTQGSAGNSLPNINGAFTVCFAFNPTSVSTSPVIFDDFQGGTGHAGWFVTPTNGAGPYLLGEGFAGPQTVNKTILGSLNIICAGVTGVGSVTGYIKLNSGPVASAAFIYNPTTTAISTFGRYATSTGKSFNGTIEEAWFSSDVPTPDSLTNLYNIGISQPGAGYRWPDTPNTKLHLIGRDFNGTTWTAPQVTLTTVGTVPSATSTETNPIPTKQRRYAISPAGITGSGTLSTTSFYYLSNNNVLDFSGNFSACMVLVPDQTDITNTSIFSSSGVSQGTPGWQVVNESGLTRLFGDSGSVTDVQLTANQLNTVCFGKSGSNLVLKVNDRPMVSAAGSITVSGGLSRLGMHWDNLIGFAGTIYEAWYSTDTPTDTLFTNIVSNVLLSS